MSDAQFGFRHNRSTEQAIDNLVNRIYLLNIWVCSWIYVKRRFARQRPCSSKTASLWTESTIQEWYRSYFSGRRQKAKVNQCSSETKNVPFGTPKGSVLGPLIIVFINDVVSLLQCEWIGYHIICWWYDYKLLIC